MSATDDQIVTSPHATRTQFIVAITVSVALLAALAATTPFARELTKDTEAILPAYAAATTVLEVVTSALLLALYNVQRSPALLILASGYLFSALMIPAWALTFPGAFTMLWPRFRPPNHGGDRRRAPAWLSSFRPRLCPLANKRCGGSSRRRYDRKECPRRLCRCGARPMADSREPGTSADLHARRPQRE